MPNIKSLITDHFSRTKYVRPPQQLEAEKFLIPALSKYVKVPFNRILLMPAAVLIQLCVGSLYAWSGYNLAIEAHIYGTNLNAKGVPVDRNVASITFNIAVAVFGLTAAALGPWLERNGPFRGAMLGSVLFFAGHLLTALVSLILSLPDICQPSVPKLTDKHVLYFRAYMLNRLLLYTSVTVSLAASVSGFLTSLPSLHSKNGSLKCAVSQLVSPSAVSVVVPSSPRSLKKL